MKFIYFCLISPFFVQCTVITTTRHILRLWTVQLMKFLFYNQRVVSTAARMHWRTFLGGFYKFYSHAWHLLASLVGFVTNVSIIIEVFAFLAKRFCEPRNERRSWLIWFYDTSKQGMGAMAIHLANVWLAGQYTGDPCTW